MGCYALLIFSGCCRKDRGKVRFLKLLCLPGNEITASFMLPATAVCNQRLHSWIMNSNSPVVLYGSNWHLLPSMSHFGGFASVNTMWIGIMMTARIISDLCWALKVMIISLNIIVQFQVILSSQPASQKESPYLHQKRLCWSGNMPMVSLFSLPQCTCSDPLVQLNLGNASGHNWCQEKRPISYKCSWEFMLLTNCTAGSNPEMFPP